MPRDSVNRLLAASWPKLSDSAVREITSALRNLRVPPTPPAPGAPRPPLTLRLDNVQVRWLSHTFDDPRYAPGYTRFDPEMLEFALPIRDQGWFFEAKMRVRGVVRLRNFPFTFSEEQIVQLTDLRFLVRLPLRDGASDRPRLHDPVAIQPRFRLKLSGLLNFETDMIHPCTGGGDVSYCYELNAERIPAPPQSYGFQGKVKLRLAEKIEMELSGFLFDDDGPIAFERKLPFDLPAALSDVLTGIPTGRLPRLWGEGFPRPAPDVPATFQFRALADEITERFAQHAPPLPGTPHGILGVVQDNHYDGEFQPCVAGQAPDSYSGAGDTAIWTGHLLAAQALRWASAPNDAERRKATDQALWLLDGIGNLFAITGVPGLICRAALPRPLADRTRDFRHREPGFKSDYYETMLNGAPWIGKGRAISPPTRDSHVGILLGFAFAYHFIADATVRERVRRHTTDLLDFLLKNGWNVPAGGRIVTTFIHQFHQQLALLRLGAAVDPSRYLSKYREAAQAADASWLPVWGGSLDPIHKYYKFNLSHATLAILLTLEDDAALRAHYARALRVLRKATGHHRNAWFNLVWILADPANAARQAEGGLPGVTVRQETRALLFEWSNRRDGVRGPNCLPRKQTPDITALEELYDADPSQVVEYRPVGTNAPLEFRVAKFALDVPVRPGKGRDFLWQRDPFDTGITLSSGQRKVDAGEPTIEAPGVDYLLPCYLADFLGVV